MKLRVVLRMWGFAGVCLFVSACTGTHSPALAIRDATVVNLADGSLDPSQTVLVAGDRIVAVGPTGDLKVPRGAEVIDAAGLYLIPGLIDMHVHALWHPSVPPSFLPLFVANGVTAVRDMGGTLELLRETRTSLAAGSLLGPRLVAAGAILDGPAPIHPEISIPISTPEEAEAAVEAVAAAGADFVKVYTLLPAGAFEAVMEAAVERELPVAGHVPAKVGPVAAAAAGMRTMEHVMSELGGFCEKAETAACERVIAAFLKHGVWQVPTLVMQGQTEATDLCGDSRLRFLPRVVLEFWFDGGLSPKGCDAEAGSANTFTPELPEEAWLARILHEAGVRLLAGSDTGDVYSLPGWSLHDELYLLVDAGLTPAEALFSATGEAARALGREGELGAVQPGYLADLVLLGADPLEDIRNTQRIEAVVANGRPFGRDSLDAILARLAGSREGGGTQPRSAGSGS